MKINLKFNSTSIQAAIDQVEDYKKKVEQFPEKAVKKTVEMGVEQAKDFAMYMNAYDTGELVNGIVGDVNGNKGKIVSTAFHTMFVEMGTGVRGAEEPNPYNYAEGWRYDVNEHGEAGWYYIGKDGRKHWTQGMPSRPFMHDTAEVIREALPWIAEGVLKDGE